MFTNLLQYKVSPTEERRLAVITGNLCPQCGCRLTIGEVEAADVCTTCYFNLHAQDAVQSSNH